MDLLTVRETADLLRVAPGTVRRWIASGRLAAVRVGRGLRVRRDAAERLLAPAGPRVVVDPDEDETFFEGRPLTRDDSLFRIIGIAGPKQEDDETSDIASDKYAYLAEVYGDRHEG